MKDELVRELEENRAELWNAIADMSEEEISTLPVAGEWTMKDLIGHIAYWEGITLDHVRESRTRGRPRPSDRNERINVINPRQAAKRKGRPWARVRAEFDNVRAALIAYVERLDEIDLVFIVPDPWNQDRFYSVGQMIRQDAIGHCREHLEQIKRVKSSS